MSAPQYPNRRVLIVDDEPDIHDDFTEMLSTSYLPPTGGGTAELGAHPAFPPTFELLHATSGEQACDIILNARRWSQPIAVAYVDIRMPAGIDGPETIRRVRTMDRDVEVVMMTAYTDKTLAEIIEDMELLHKLLYIRKPFVHEEIQQITVALVGKWNLEQDLAEKQRQLAGSQRRLEAVLNATRDAMAMRDRTGRLMFANRAYLALMNMTLDELKDLTPDELAARSRERFSEPRPGAVEGAFALRGVRLTTAAGAGDRTPDQPNQRDQRLYYRTATEVRDGAEVIGELEVFRDASQEIESA